MSSVGTKPPFEVPPKIIVLFVTSKKIMLVPPLDTLSLLLLSKVTYPLVPYLSRISIVDLFFELSCNLVSCRQRMEIS